MPAQHLQPEQLKLFWERFTQVLRVWFFWEFLPIIPEVYLRDQTLILDKKAWLEMLTLIHLSGILLGWDQGSVQASKVLHP